MVLALKRNKAGSRDSSGHPSACFEGYPCIMSRVHHKSRDTNLREQRGHVSIAIREKIASGICRRTRNSLELIEPVGLLLVSTRNELRREHLPECWVFLA